MFAIQKAIAHMFKREVILQLFNFLLILNCFVLCLFVLNPLILDMYACEECKGSGTLLIRNLEGGVKFSSLGEQNCVQTQCTENPCYVGSTMKNEE